MHNTIDTGAEFVVRPPLDFAWVELTNVCNLQCKHCYNSSSPFTSDRDLLSEEDYKSVIGEIRKTGCEKIQFIGGEPTLNKSLPVLIDTSRNLGFTFVEVFTNLIRLPEELLNNFSENQVSVATSFYSANSDTHDAITNSKGSQKRCAANIKRVLERGLQLRVGIILMEDNLEDYETTADFLRSLGVENIGFDHIRGVGRAKKSECNGMEELCGSCSGGIISIGPDGVVTPCNMSKAWPVGSVLDEPLDEIIASERLENVRRQIHETTSQNCQSESMLKMICDPKTCGPYSACCPSTQSCLPCAPNGCNPCFPQG